MVEIVQGRADFVTNVERAFDEIDSHWRNYPGLVIVGSHQPELVENKIERIRWAREEKIPYLGICLGLQLSVIEFCRHVLSLPDATSEEFGEKGYRAVIKLPSLRVGLHKVNNRMESHWHNYRVNPKLVPKLKKHFDMTISDDGVVEEMQLMTHSFFFLTTYHPEYQNSPEQPHQVLLNFITACKVHE